MAAALGLTEICQWLITPGCNVDARSDFGTPLHCSLLGRYGLPYTLVTRDWSQDKNIFDDDQYGEETPGQMQVLEILIANGADCNASYHARFGKDISCCDLAFYFHACVGADHPLVKLVAAGAQLGERYLEKLRDSLLQSFMSQDRRRLVNTFIETLTRILKEKNQDRSTKLLPILNMNSSSAPQQVNYPESAHTRLEKLVDTFCLAIQFDQAQVMEELLQHRRLNISHKDENSNLTFLHKAVQYQSINAIRLLLSLGADVNSIEKEGETPLHLAINGKFEGRYQECISLLLDYRANVNAINYRGRTVWHNAARRSRDTSMRLLLDRCENETRGLEISDNKGLIPLFVVARDNNSRICDLLLCHSSYIHKFCPDGLSLVHYAFKMNSNSTLCLIQGRGIKLTEKTSDGRTGLHFISRITSPEIVRLLINSGVDAGSQAFNGETPMHVLSCLWPMLDLETFMDLFDLLATKESIESTTTGGYTPLHYALNPPAHLRNNPYDYTLIRHAELLIMTGANIHTQLPDRTSCFSNLTTKWTAFNRELKRSESRAGHFKANRSKEVIQGEMRGLLALIKLVVVRLKTDTDILTELIPGQNAGDVQMRPINWSIASGNEELANLLVEKGIDVNLQNAGAGVESSWSTINSACWYKCSLELFRKISKKSTRLQEHDKQGNCLTHITCASGSCSLPSILEELCNSGLDPNLPAANAGAETPLMLAAISGKQEHIKILLERGANIRAKDFRGWEAAHYAAEYGHTDIMEQFLDFEIDWNNCLTDLKENVLHLATRNGHYGLVHFILARSLITDLNCLDTHKDSALNNAVFHSSARITRELLEAGADINAIGRHGSRAIHIAARSGDLNIIRHLLNHNCILAEDDIGMTPKLTALKHGHQEAFDILKRHEELKGSVLRFKILSRFY